MMAEQKRILAFAGSARRESVNRRLLGAAVGMAEDMGLRCTVLELGDYPLPLYDGDLEAAEGVPDNAQALRGLFVEHAGFLIAAPEYNSSITPLLKNVIDWVSRPAANGSQKSPYVGKLASLLAASPGALGGLRGLNSVRSILTNLGVTVLPQQFALSRANSAFTQEGKLADESAAKAVHGVVSDLSAWIKRLG